MTLAKGDHVVKINPTSKEPIKYDSESHIEFEVIDLSCSYMTSDNETHQFVLLKKVM